MSSITADTSVAFLGPEGTFTHAAAMRLAPGARLVAQPDISAAFDFVIADKGHAVIPIESSVAGPVQSSLDRLIDSTSIRVVAEHAEPITFNAFRRPGEEGPVARVLSHPHALAQCSRFIAFINAAVKSEASTAAACIALEVGDIAIAAPICGEMYSLDTFAEKVEDSPNAQTRFLLLENKSRPLSPGVEVGHFMMMVSPASDAPGAVAKIFSHFADRGIGVTSLLVSTSADHRCVVTVDRPGGDSDIKDLVHVLAAAGNEVRQLGTFHSSGFDTRGRALAVESLPSTLSAVDKQAISALMGWTRDS